MYKRIAILALALVFGMALGSGIFAEEAKKEAKDEIKHEFVGAKKCKICHKKDGVHPSWAETPHATAWDQLTPEQQKDPKFVKYYSTGTTAKGVLLEGVQCEACHGAGADYKKKKIMADRDAAMAKGLLIPDEKTCLGCHNDKAVGTLAATAKDFDYGKMKAKGIHALSEDTKKPADVKDLGGK